MAGTVVATKKTHLLVTFHQYTGSSVSRTGWPAWYIFIRHTFTLAVAVVEALIGID